MVIAGGVYRELCCMPSWDAMFGSGGRAAAAISSLSPNSTLHTYLETDIDTTLSMNFGIPIHTFNRSSGIAISYFHSLSKPHVEPPVDEITKESTITARGEVVLRFGFLEGDAVVNAQNAIYDPQTWRNPPAFRSNGSTASKLAIVLNELELTHSTGLKDLGSAADQLMSNEEATTIVVKSGAKGATVFERDGSITKVPAYRSTNIFKIGTGDVFSAIFAHCWGERKMTAPKAADVASRAVAHYCSTMSFPEHLESISNYEPINYAAPGLVLLQGSIETIGQRYTMEEARFALTELGIRVSCPALGDYKIEDSTARLVLFDGSGSIDPDILESVISSEIPVIILHEGQSTLADIDANDSNIVVAKNFSSAVYFAAWAASENSTKTDD